MDAETKTTSADSPQAKAVGITPSWTSRGIPEFTDLVAACRHRLGQTLLLAFVLSTTLFAVNWWITEPQFQSDALVRVREQQDVVFTPQTSRAADSAFFYSQEKLVLSPQVLGDALRRPEIRALTRGLPNLNRIQWLRDQLKVRTQSGSEVMTITASHSSASLSQALANAVTESYLQEVTSRLTNDRQRREQELERAAREADRELDRLWNQLNQLAQSIGSDSTQSLTIRDELQYQAYRDFARQLREVQSRGADLQRLLEEQRQAADHQTLPIDLLVERQLQLHPDVIAATERIALTEQKIKDMRQIVAKDDSPRLAKLQEDLTFYTSQLDATIETLRPRLEEQILESRRSEEVNKIASIKQQIESNRAEKEYLRQRLSELDRGVIQTDERSGVELEKARHAVERQSRLADGLWQSLQEMRIESQSQPRVKLIELAELPSKPSRSRQLKIAAAGWLSGGVIAILLMGYLEWCSCKIRSVHDIRSLSRLPVFADQTTTGRGRRRRQCEINKSAASEAAARLMLQHRDKNCPVIMIANGEPQGSAHLTSSELAATLAKFRKRTLLIDCDLELHALTTLLDTIPSQPTTVSESDAGPQLQVHSTDNLQIDFLSFADTGESIATIVPVELQRILDFAQSNYDIVVLSAPMLASAETLLLAAEADVVLIDATIGISRYDHLLNLQQAALDCGIVLGGSILRSHATASRPSEPLRVKSDRVLEDSELDQATELQRECMDLQREIHSTSTSQRSPERKDESRTPST